MKDVIKICDLEVVNTAESIYGDLSVKGDKIIVPFFNVQVIDDLIENDIPGGQYIDYCFLVFENVQSFTFDYELSRKMNASIKRECMGGVYFFSNESYEFWVNFEKGNLYVPKNFQLSQVPWEPKEDIKIFFNMIN